MFFRKYLRDSDRVELAKIGYEYCLETAEKLVHKKATDPNLTVRNHFVADVYKIWQSRPKTGPQEKKAMRLLEDVYKECRKDEVWDLYTDLSFCTCD